MSLRQVARMTVKTVADLPTLSLLYKANQIDLTPPSTARPPPTTVSYPSLQPIKPSKALNDKISLYRGDITTLAVDAIVNAANTSLLGGGGVDGAIHRAAGPQLYQECKTLGGCATGGAKITDAYRLPCKKVIHAVGPVYNVIDPGVSEEDLTSCYATALELAIDNSCRSIAFSAISTGVYGYPSREAAPVAITAVKRFLESDMGTNLDLVVFVVFEKKDLDAYHKYLPYVSSTSCPPPPPSFLFICLAVLNTELTCLNLQSLSSSRP